MGIFKKRKQSEDENLIVKSEFIPSDIDAITEKVSKDAESLFDENIGFHTGFLKGNFQGIKDSSETLDVIRNKVVKNQPLSDTQARDEKQDIEDDKTYDIPSDNQDNPPKSDDDYESLLEKCKAYTIDENGKDFSKEEDSLYELISVAEILKQNQLKSLDSLSKKYDISIEDETEKTFENDAPANNSDADNNNIDTKPVDEHNHKTPGFVSLTEETVSDDVSDDQKFEDYILKNNPDTLVDEFDTNIPDLSDIDTAQKLNPELHNHSGEGATVKYTPVKDGDSSKNRISISSTTQNIDLSEKLNIESHETSNYNPKKEDPADDITDIEVSEEINDKNDLRENIKKAKVKMRSKFLALSASVFISIVLVISALISDNSSDSYNKSLLVFLFISYILNCIANIDMFASLKKIAQKIINTDFTATVLSVVTIVLTALMIIKPDNAFYSEANLLLATSSVILTVRCYSSYLAVSSRLGNLKAMSSKYDVYGVDFIDDQSVAYFIAKDSVDGDILIAAPHKTSFINSFNKYSTHSSVLSGRFGVFQIVWLIITIIIGFLGYAKYHTVSGAMFCVLTLVCALAFPVLYFIDSLPCYSASKKLNKSGAAIFGTAAAKQLDNANAVIISTEELFPSGSIVLKDMKILSENNLDDTILRATSLTEAAGSPLTPIFKKIAKTDSSYSLPDSDTVKYEDSLGISGWVDNELLFIGNRSLMQTHGIEVPDFEVDKKILKNGCFPIYVATVQKACALLIVQYIPRFEIAKELRKLSGLGVTLLFINSDPNITESMICDHFDIYEDSVKIVSNGGKFMYENSVVSKEPISSPASFKRKNLSFVKIMNAASAIKKSNNLFSIIYIIASILLAVGFVYLKFATDNTFFSAKTVFLTEMTTSLISLILYNFKKP